MASIVNKSQSNRAHLGYGGTGDSYYGCAADKSTWMLLYPDGPTFLRNVS